MEEYHQTDIGLLIMAAPGTLQEHLSTEQHSNHFGEHVSFAGENEKKKDHNGKPYLTVC